MKTNKAEIILDQDLNKHLFERCLLRKAKYIGDREVINHTQLSKLRWNFVKFHVAPELQALSKS